MSGAVAVNGEGGARDDVGCCCWDSSQLTPPTATAPVPDDGPSGQEKTPVRKPGVTSKFLHNSNTIMRINSPSIFDDR